MNYPRTVSHIYLKFQYFHPDPIFLIHCFEMPVSVNIINVGSIFCFWSRDGNFLLKFILQDINVLGGQAT